MCDEKPSHSIGISMDNLSTPYGSLLSLSPRTGPYQQQQLMAASDSARVIVSSSGSEEQHQEQGSDAADLGGVIVASGAAPGSVTLISFSPYTGSGPALLAISLGSALLCLRIELKPLLEHHRCGSFPCGSRPRWKAMSWCPSHDNILAAAHEVRWWATGTGSGRPRSIYTPAYISGPVSGILQAHVANPIMLIQSRCLHQAYMPSISMFSSNHANSRYLSVSDNKQSLVSALQDTILVGRCATAGGDASSISATLATFQRSSDGHRSSLVSIAWCSGHGVPTLVVSWAAGVEVLQWPSAHTTGADHHSAARHCACVC